MKHTMMATVLAASALFAAGCATAQETARAPQKQTAQERAAPSREAAPAGARISFAEAVSRVERLHPGGRVKKVELERDFGRLYYEVDVVLPDYREYDVKIDAVSGEVISNRWDD